ncbi:MAG TPA: hypothetical protein VKZ53_13280 [Candidatus Angelobacter sp.]|nr:hypothetical protein [Candidatus Angelobacter sp.]
MRALRTSWKREPFQEGIVVPYQATFDAEQFSRLKDGLIPKQMEDKWFIYYEEPYLFFHRGWTGQPVYRVKLQRLNDGAETTEALWSKELAKDSGLDREYQAHLIDFLISNLLLGQIKAFPAPSGMNESKHPLFQHHVSGTSYPIAESGPNGRLPWYACVRKIFRRS